MLGKPNPTQCLFFARIPNKKRSGKVMQVTYFQMEETRFICILPNKLRLMSSFSPGELYLQFQWCPKLYACTPPVYICYRRLRVHHTCLYCVGKTYECRTHVYTCCIHVRRYATCLLCVHTLNIVPIMSMRCAYTN